MKPKAPKVAFPFLKKCAKCGEEKGHRARSDSGRPQPYCVECTSAYLKEYRERRWTKAKARNTWKNMVGRCHQKGWGANCPPGVPRYSEYGAKGIRVCVRWRNEKGLENFVTDMGLPPTKDATLDRKNPKRNYSKSNCRWVDERTQTLNRRTTHWITAEDPETGEPLTLCVSDWAKRTGIKRSTIHARIRRGWSEEEAVSAPLVEPGYRYQESPDEDDGVVPF